MVEVNGETEGIEETGTIGMTEEAEAAEVVGEETDIDQRRLDRA